MRQMCKEMVQFKAPDGFIEAVSATARRQHMTSSEFLRRAVLDRMAECGVSLAESARAIAHPEESS